MDSTLAVGTTTLVLAAHGSSHTADVSLMLGDIVAALRRRDCFEDVIAAFYKEPPLFDRVLEGIESDQVIVVPMFTSNGHYTQTVLPREMGLGGARTIRNQQVIYCTPPVGEHPAIVRLTADLAIRTLHEYRLSSADTAIFLVGHGTPRHAESAGATSRLAGTLQKLFPETQVLACFLDECPLLEDALRSTSRGTAVVIPYLIGRGIHAGVDLPRRVRGALDETGLRRVIHTSSPFEQPEIVELILDLVNCVTEAA